MGEERDYGVGMFFLPAGRLERAQSKKMLEIIVAKEGMEFLARRVFERSAPGAYAASFSSRTVVYKGMFLVGQLRQFAAAPAEFGKPWFGQLMAGPQLLAYLIQVNIWMERYHISV